LVELPDRHSLSNSRSLCLFDIDQSCGYPRVVAKPQIDDFGAPMDTERLQPPNATFLFTISRFLKSA